MRFDEEVTLRKISAGSYDLNTGNYDQDTVTDTAVYADVTDSSAGMLQMVYGKLRQGSLTVRMQGYPQPFDELIVSGKRYAVDYQRRLMNKTVYVVSEVQ